MTNICGCCQLPIRYGFCVRHWEKLGVESRIHIMTSERGSDDRAAAILEARRSLEPESFEEQLDRVREIAARRHRQALSPEDRSAMEALLNGLATLIILLEVDTPTQAKVAIEELRARAASPDRELRVLGYRIRAIRADEVAGWPTLSVSREQDGALWRLATPWGHVTMRKETR